MEVKALPQPGPCCRPKTGLANISAEALVWKGGSMSDSLPRAGPVPSQMPTKMLTAAWNIKLPPLWILNLSQECKRKECASYNHSQPRDGLITPKPGDGSEDYPHNQVLQISFPFLIFSANVSQQLNSSCCCSLF